MNNHNRAPRFSLGRTVATPGALEVMRDAGISPFMLLHRHRCGDWGELDGENRAANDRAVSGCLRILSAYRIGLQAETLWVITEWDRSVTTILTPSEC